MRLKASQPAPPWVGQGARFDHRGKAGAPVPGSVAGAVPTCNCVLPADGSPRRSAQLCCRYMVSTAIEDPKVFLSHRPPAHRDTKRGSDRTYGAREKASPNETASRHGLYLRPP